MRWWLCALATDTCISLPPDRSLTLPLKLVLVPFLGCVSDALDAGALLSRCRPFALDRSNCR